MGRTALRHLGLTSSHRCFLLSSQLWTHKNADWLRRVSFWRSSVHRQLRSQTWRSGENRSMRPANAGLAALSDWQIVRPPKAAIRITGVAVPGRIVHPGKGSDWCTSQTTQPITRRNDDAASATVERSVIRFRQSDSHGMVGRMRTGSSRTGRVLTRPNPRDSVQHNNSTVI